MKANHINNCNSPLLNGAISHKTSQDTLHSSSIPFQFDSGNYLEPQKCLVNQKTNIEDSTLLLIDHWASKCVRFADEFQASRSFEDAQSNLAELEESLKEYWKLQSSDAAFRVDILHHCILTNIIDGLESNSHIFSNEVPSSILTILTHSLFVSSQLGRYGFQSFKQCLKIFHFLINFYKTRNLQPLKRLPIILWQSVKKVSINGTTLHPTLYPGVFNAHQQSCSAASDNTAMIQIDFAKKEHYLRTCSSTEEIVAAFKSLAEQALDFGCDHVQPELVLKGKRQYIQNKFADTTLNQMIHCDIDVSLTVEDEKLFSDTANGEEKVHLECLEKLKQNQGGPIVLRFKSSHFNRSQGTHACTANFFLLGTKQYGKQHTQIVLIEPIEKEDSSRENWMIVDCTGKKVQVAEKIEISNFKWDLVFSTCPSQCWVQPKILFVERLKISTFIEECTISFEDHLCDTDTIPKCLDCLAVLDQKCMSVDQVFDNGSVEINVKLDFGIWGKDVKDFALYKFALSVPIEVRSILKEIQKESKFRRRNESQLGLFCDKDFDKILRLWETHQDFYYAVWYNS